MKEQNPIWSNQLEPASLISAFVQFPPLDFETKLLEPFSTPIFIKRFNLLTSLENSLQKLLDKIPLFKLFREKYLSLRTIFVGTTVTEYLTFSKKLDLNSFIASLKVYAKSNGARAIILKDIPVNSALLTELENNYAANLIEACKRNNFSILSGQALAYLPIEFKSIDQYLATLSGSRRKDLKRKLKKRSEVDIETIPTGDKKLTEASFVRELYNLYLAVFEQSEIQFDKLTQEFFANILQNSSSEGKLFLYWHKTKLIGFNLCYIHNNNLIDKYIGLNYPEAHDFSLYFISWIVNLEYAIEHGIDNYIAGWTDPLVKSSLGTRFTLSKHAVFFFSPFLQYGLKPFRSFFENDAKLLASLGSRNNKAK